MAWWQGAHLPHPLPQAAERWGCPGLLWDSAGGPDKGQQKEFPLCRAI